MRGAPFQPKVPASAANLAHPEPDELLGSEGFGGGTSCCCMSPDGRYASYHVGPEDDGGACSIVRHSGGTAEVVHSASPSHVEGFSPCSRYHLTLHMSGDPDEVWAPHTARPVFLPGQEGSLLLRVVRWGRAQLDVPLLTLPP